jgi:hypothetical protein
MPAKETWPKDGVRRQTGRFTMLAFICVKGISKSTFSVFTIFTLLE